MFVCSELGVLGACPTLGSLKKIEALDLESKPFTPRVKLGTVNSPYCAEGGGFIVSLSHFYPFLSLWMFSYSFSSH